MKQTIVMLEQKKRKLHCLIQIFSNKEIELTTIFRLKTGLMKWKPDYDVAANEYSKAGNFFVF